MPKHKQNDKIRIVEVIHHSPIHTEIIYTWDDEEPKQERENVAPKTENTQLTLDMPKEIA